VNRRTSGQFAAAFIALLAFGWAAWASHVSAMPEFKVYDGYWMMLGAAIAFAAVAPLAWGLRREVSIVVIALATVVGSIVPLVISAKRYHLPVAARLRGAWVLGGADLVGPALVIGFVALWFAIRKYKVRAGGHA
jgi:hypothetical protein